MATPYRQLDKENNNADSYSQVGTVVARNVVIFDEDGNTASLGGGAEIDLYKLNNIDDESTSAGVTYLGKTKDDGTYAIVKIDETSPALPVFTYATITNNVSTTTYSTAWTNRASLTYNRYEIAF